jgi:hypothetical protein
MQLDPASICFHRVAAPFPLVGGPPALSLDLGILGYERSPGPPAARHRRPPRSHKSRVQVERGVKRPDNSSTAVGAEPRPRRSRCVWGGAVSRMTERSPLLEPSPPAAMMKFACLATLVAAATAEAGIHAPAGGHSAYYTILLCTPILLQMHPLCATNVCPSATSPTNDAGSSARRATQLSACFEGST